MDLVTYLDDLAANGRIHFTIMEAVQALGATPVAVRAAVRRLAAKGRVASPIRGFYVAVPPEYRQLGCLPADQFVPQLMGHLGLVHYAGLLSAASLHGAAHQAPMVFQVVVAQNRSEIRCGRVRVAFVARRNVSEVPIVEQNTLRGILRISSPEATAFDLVGYPDHSGGLSNVATVLSELADKMVASKLIVETQRSPMPWTQRLGYLLERVEANALAAPLAEHVRRHAREYVALRARKPAASAPREPRWRLLLNDVVEPDQ
jgi:predicted transcriptional regulator of viral defense system